MCFLELLKKIDNWIVTSASISDECRLITMDQVRIVWIAIQNDKWAKVNFSLMKYNRTECFQLFKPTTQKVCSFNLKKIMCFPPLDGILCIEYHSIYLHIRISNLLSENSKKSPFNFQLPFEIPFFFRFFPCNHINEILYTKTVFQLQFYAMQNFFLLFITPEQFFFL